MRNFCTNNFRQERGKWEDVSAADMGKTDALEKAWLVGRGGGRGEIPDSGGNVYGDGDDSEQYSLLTDRNGDDTTLIGTQITDQTERGI